MHLVESDPDPQARGLVDHHGPSDPLPETERMLIEFIKASRDGSRQKLPNMQKCDPDVCKKSGHTFPGNTET